jgi:catechol-2,3-dioxygenase
MATRKPYSPGIFGVHLQVRDLDRSVAFYRDALGLEVDWNDGTLAVLRSPGDTGDLLAIRKVGENAPHHLGESGVTRLFWRVSDQVGLDSTEERLARHSVPYTRHRDSEPDGISVHDPDGLGVTLISTDTPPIAGAPPAMLYWEH